MVHLRNHVLGRFDLDPVKTDSTQPKAGQQMFQLVQSLYPYGSYNNKKYLLCTYELKNNDHRKKVFKKKNMPPTRFELAAFAWTQRLVQVQRSTPEL